MQILTLQERIKMYYAYKDAYYTGEASISDEDFDKFEQDLIDDGFDPIVGYTEIDDSLKVSHRVKMLSLPKRKVLTDTMPAELAHEIFNKYGEGELSWKYDGLAIEAQYTNNTLSMISTRGNGDVGQNVYVGLKHLFPEVLTIRQNLPNFDVRCEIIIAPSVFNEKYSKKYSHPRNLAAGIVNDQNQNDPRKADLLGVVLEIVNSDTEELISERPVALSHMYKETFKCESAYDIIEFFNALNIMRIDKDFGTDGLVYSKLDVTKVFHDGHYPEHAIAIKFKPPVLTSTITNITWTLHKTGRYVPKIHFIPITVDGRQISKATGHNLEYLVKNDLCIGKEVNVVLANDIIPQIQKIQ